MPSSLNESSRLWLVRHGQSAAQTGEELSIDANLSALGRKQSIRLGEVIGKVRFDAVFISPLRRARQTYQAAGASIHGGFDAEFDTRILEDMQPGGYLPLLPYEKLPNYALSDRHGDWDTGIAGRLTGFYKDLERLSLERSDILVVSHAMALNLILRLFLNGSIGADKDGGRNCRPGNASISILERSPGAKTFDSLRLWNYQGHLNGLPGDWSLPKH